MRQPIVAGNWKMHGSKASSEALLRALCAGYDPAWNSALVVLVPSIFLSLTQDLLRGSPLFWGAQTMSEHPEGAYTGEISGLMLHEFGCRYVLVGHSERRSLYGETDDIVAKKLVAAVSVGLTPILCVGENLSEREMGAQEQVVGRQLEAVMRHPQGMPALEKAVIAYEPVWAIGTGLAATPEEAQYMHTVIRQYVVLRDPGLALRLQILYGGSVKASNAAHLFAMPDIDGVLVGGASLGANEFLEINRLCNNC